VSIFLFLKIFGDNEFEVPVLFEEGIPDCAGSGQPHKVPSETLLVPDNQFKSQTNGAFLIIGALDLDKRDEFNEQLIQLVRIQDAFYEIGSPTFVLLDAERGNSTEVKNRLKETGMSENNYQLFSWDQNRLDNFVKCGLGLDPTEAYSKLVLVDPEKRIRGIYGALETEQTEQLILELKILRKQAE